jgi:hypothetical protein
MTDKERTDAACKRLTAEAGKLEDGDPCKVLIAEYLMDKAKNPRVALALCAEEKTLKKLNDKMWELARSRQSGQGAHVADAELFAMADEYYGIGAPAASDVIDVTDLL